jgi:hypothetical protein
MSVSVTYSDFHPMDVCMLLLDDSPKDSTLREVVIELTLLLLSLFSLVTVFTTLSGQLRMFG